MGVDLGLRVTLGHLGRVGRSLIHFVFSYISYLPSHFHLRIILLPILTYNHQGRRHNRRPSNRCYVMGLYYSYEEESTTELCPAPQQHS